MSLSTEADTEYYYYYMYYYYLAPQY